MEDLTNEMFTDKSLIDVEEFINSLSKYRRIAVIYDNAVKYVIARIEMIKNECEATGMRVPVRSVSSRIKEPLSIIAKLKKKNMALTPQAILETVNDMAGIRVICEYIPDIYKIREALQTDENITLIKEKDYIKNPKKNGYRSLHIIVAVQIPFVDGVHDVKCEIQLRTTAMDSWASLEHNLRYKKDIEQNQDINDKLKQCSDMLYVADGLMQNVAEQMKVI